MAVFGTGFGSTPAFGTNTAGTNVFGSTATTSTGTLGPFGGFGAAGVSTPAPTFGAPTTTSAAFGGFGGSTLGSNFGTLGGAATTTSAPLFGGFGLSTTTTTSAPTFSFTPIGSTNTTVTSFPGLNTGFGGTNTTFSSGLGTFGTSGLGAKSTFGTGTFGTGSTFGTTAPFGSTTGLGTGSAFDGSAFGAGTLGAFGQTSAQNNALTALTTALSCPVVFGDERDVVLLKWNTLQALWGVGKGIYSSQAQPIDFTPDNPFCRFKAIGYSLVPTAKNKDGLVSLTIGRKVSDVVAQQTQLVDNMHRIMGSRPTLSVCIEGVKPVSDVKTEVIIYILERAPTGASRRIPTSETFAYLNQPNIKSQLVGLGIEGVIPKSAPTKEQLQQYLDNTAFGIDPLLWQQAKLDNPDSDRLIPVPMIGFSELQLRLKFQEQETTQHQSRLNLIGEDITELQRKHANMMSRIAELKRKELELGHRVLKVMVKQETNRKLGLAIQGDEEQLRVQLEGILAELSAPTQFKGRLNELMSQIRMHNQQTLSRVDERYTVDISLQHDIKQLLKQQQQGLTHLVEIIRSDLDDLRLIENGLKESGHKRL